MRRAAASAVLAEFGEYRDDDEPAPPFDEARELIGGAVELARQLYADGLSEGRIAAELAKLGLPALVANVGAAMAATDRLADAG